MNEFKDIFIGIFMDYEDTGGQLYNARWQMEFAYYESSDMVDVRGRLVQGLGLATDVLEDLYYRNAERWYPGL